jgi:hypothetical protein
MSKNNPYAVVNDFMGVIFGKATKISYLIRAVLMEDEPYTKSSGLVCARPENQPKPNLQSIIHGIIL